MYIIKNTENGAIVAQELTLDVAAELLTALTTYGRWVYCIEPYSISG